MPRFHATSSFFLNQRISQYFACFCEFRGFTWISQPRNRAKYHKTWAASFTLYKLATKNLHLATIFLQVVAKRRPENFVNFKPCLIHCNVLDRKETFFANNSNSQNRIFPIILVQKCQIFLLLFLVKTRLEIMLNDYLDKKETFFDSGKVNFYKSQKSRSSKGVNPRFWSKM